MKEFYTNARVFGNNIFYRGYDEKGQQVQRKISYNPSLYIPSDSKSAFKTLDGTYLKKVEQGSIKDAKEFVKNYGEIENFKIYGNTNWQYAFLGDQHEEEFIDYDFANLSVANVDIEVDSSDGFPDPAIARWEMTLITMKINDHIYVFGTKDFETDRKDVTYIKFSDERSLLRGFINKWDRFRPDIMTGWNIYNFDIPYIINRCRLILGEEEAKRMSPWKFIMDKKAYDNFGREYKTYDLVGVSIIDYMDAYKKFTYVTRSSYKLDNIGEIEVGQKKVDYGEYKNLHTLYAQNHQLFVEYGIQDVEIVDKLEEKLQLIELIITLAYQAKINFDDPFKQVRMWDALIYNKLKAEGTIIPQKVHNRKVPFMGAYVKEPKVGFYEWIVSFDLNSLYPHLIMQYNISPETFVDQTFNYDTELSKLTSKVTIDGMINKEYDFSLLKERDLTVTPNGQLFKTDKRGFLPSMMEDMYNKRKQFKKKMLQAKSDYQNATTKEEKRRLKKLISKYDLMQMGFKITLNSAYGAFGSEYFRFFDVRMAEAVTSSGQLSIRWIENAFNDFLNNKLKTEGVDYVPYADTDSNYISLKEVIESVFDEDEIKDTPRMIDFMDNVCKKALTPLVEKSYEELQKYTNAREQKMIMEREVLAKNGIWTGKKRYALEVYNEEGVAYKEPKIKVTGLEIVRSSTPKVCREALSKVVKTMLDGDHQKLIQYVEDFRQEFNELSAEDIAAPKSIKVLQKYKCATNIYKKGSPQHAKGSLLYNDLIMKHDLKDKYERVGNGDNVKIVYLKEPNPIRETAIAFIDDLPKEFDLHRYIDYNMQFEKNFLKPVRNLTDAVGWSLEDKATLDDFFG